MEDQLAPLPTTFDPGSMTHAESSRVPEKADDELVPLPMEFKPTQRMNALNGHDETAARDDMEGRGITSDHGEKADRWSFSKHADSETVQDRTQVLSSNVPAPAGKSAEEDTEVRPEDDPYLMGILQSLQYGQDDGDETKDQEKEREIALTSPLSDLPDLPTTLPLSPDPPKRAMPPPPPALTVVTKKVSPPPSPLTPLVAPSLPAESSTAAAQRSTTPPITSKATTTKRPRPTKSKAAKLDEKSGKSKRKSKANSSENGGENSDLESRSDSDDLRSLSEVKTEGNGVGPGKKGKKDGQGERRKYKKQKGPDGKPIRSSVKSRKRLDQVLGIGRDGEGPPEKIAPRTKIFNDAKIVEFLRGKTRETQLATCQRPRYAKWGKCTQCIGKVGGDSCRFRDYRVFKINPKTSEILGPGWFESTEWKEETTLLPREFNVPMTREHMLKIEQTVAPLLLPLITRELRHVVKNKAIKRGVDAAKHRAVCDFCASTIFGGWFFCKKCGRDYCLACERYFSDSFDKMGQSPWHLPDAARPKLLRCTIQPPGAHGDSDKTETPKASGRQPAFHFRSDLQPVSRFSEEELRGHWSSLAEFVLNADGSVGERLKLLGLSSAGEQVVSMMQDWVASRPAPSTPDTSTWTLKLDEVDKLYMTKTHPTADRIPDPAGLEDHSRPFLYIDMAQLSLNAFDQLWARVEPIVVDRVGEKLKMSWTPDDFIQKFGEETCFVVECQTERVTKMRLGRFFSYFKGGEAEDKEDQKGDDKDKVDKIGEDLGGGDKDGQDRSTEDKSGEGKGGEPKSEIANGAEDKDEKNTNGEGNNGQVKRQGDRVGQERANRPQRILKLKDWPTTDDFANSHPDLYNDFCDALPVPDYTRREGVLNLYAHFPPGPTRPDIGPKMYNAFEAVETEGGFGSTRLHMDVADAVNVMLYASPRADGQPGCAVWDLFRTQDADKIRLYLKRKFDKTHMFTDPIHSQMFYMDAKMRKELWEKYEVVSWRVYQYPGQAVFIPAGCAHQVCNLANCIKIALDFVSTHNAARCQQLSQDFRTENFVKIWKDDVLQLYNVLWYAWTNVRETRERWKDEEEQKETEAKARAARLASLQNGEHVDSTTPSGMIMTTNPPFSPGLGHLRHPTSGGFLSPNVSSVRDEEYVSPRRTSSPSASASRGGSPTPNPPVQPPTLAAVSSEQTTEDTKPVSDQDTPVQSLARTLLSAALDASEPPPPPEARVPSSATNWGGKVAAPNAAAAGRSKKAVVPPNPPMSNRPKSMTTSQMIKTGAMPLDIAVSAARLQMGSGGDDAESGVVVGEVGDGVKDGEETSTVTGVEAESVTAGKEDDAAKDRGGGVGVGVEPGDMVRGDENAMTEDNQGVNDVVDGGDVTMGDVGELGAIAGVYGDVDGRMDMDEVAGEEDNVDAGEWMAAANGMSR